MGYKWGNFHNNSQPLIFYKEKNLHREVRDSPMLDIYETQLDRLLNHFVYTMLLPRKFDQVILEVPFQPGTL